MFNETTFEVLINDVDVEDEDEKEWDYYEREERTPWVCGRKKRAANLFGYTFEDIEESSWYTKFLQETGGVRQKTYTDSRHNRFGPFRSHFGFTLHRFDILVQIFYDNGWVKPTKRYSTGKLLKIKTELLILGCLHKLANSTPSRQLETSTNISTSEHLLFFHFFLQKMYSIKDIHIAYPSNEEDLRRVMDKYASVHLPGCGGSIDVVHVKWSNCPAGDFNRCKGKESYASVAFEVIAGFDQEIFGVSSAQFGTRNDKHIVRLDDNVKKICLGWYKNIVWYFYDLDGMLQRAVGIYLICCDNGCLRWPTLICPFKHSNKSTAQGYFSTNLESVRKDVECVFGILKKRWRILDFGIRFRSIFVCEKIFVTCCILHNMMLSEMQRDTSYRVGVGFGNDGMWMEGATEEQDLLLSERALGVAWDHRMNNLVDHLQYVARRRRSRHIV